MFYDCGALKTISLYDETNWSSITNSDVEMFKYCWRLEGEKGTAYADDEIMDKSYAKIDGGIDNPGYFTARPSTKLQSLYVDDHQYFPVAGESLSKDITFYDAKEKLLPKSGKDEAGNDVYVQSDLGGKKDDGEIFYAAYYHGNGEFRAVRSINDVSFNTLYPNAQIGVINQFDYTTDWAQNNLVHGGGKCIETVEELKEAINPFSDNPPKINGVYLTNIWHAYNPDGLSSGFGGAVGRFWSCVAYNEDGAWYWYSSLGESGNWNKYSRDHWLYVCVSRAFN